MCGPNSSQMILKKALQIKQIRDVLKSYSWATFPMVFKEGSIGGDPVS